MTPEGGRGFQAVAGRGLYRAMIRREFVIGGYRPGSNGIDALLVGYYDDTGLRFAGKVRAGFVPHLRREVKLTRRLGLIGV